MLKDDFRDLFGLEASKNISAIQIYVYQFIAFREKGKNVGQKIGWSK